MKLFTTDADIKKATDSIARRGKKWQQDVHKVACSILRRWHETGDVRVPAAQLTALFEAMPTGTRRQGFSIWVTGFTKFVWNKETNCFVSGGMNKITTDEVRSAIDEPFWDFSPEVVFKPINFESMLKAALTKAKARIAKPVEGDEIDPDMVAQLEAIIEGSYVPDH